MLATEYPERKPGAAAVSMQPLLKWAGGKRRLLKYLLPLIPCPTGRYYEPFLGGGALFFAHRPLLATLSDKNTELIACYEEVKKNPAGVVDALQRLTNNEMSYYRIRSSKPAEGIAKAARFLYLTTLSFNGIYRQNLKGDFNVPYGFKTHINPATTLAIFEASQALQRASLKAGDFEAIVKSAKAGDFVYFDPPYTVAHGHNGFIKYNSTIFSWADQMRLAKCAERLSAAGATVVVSNADHYSIRDLYKSFKVIRVDRQSVIAASKQHRKPTTECIFVSKDAAK